MEIARIVKEKKAEENLINIIKVEEVRECTNKDGIKSYYRS